MSTDVTADAESAEIEVAIVVERNRIRELRAALGRERARKREVDEKRARITCAVADVRRGSRLSYTDDETPRVDTVVIHVKKYPPTSSGMVGYLVNAALPLTAFVNAHHWPRYDQVVECDGVLYACVPCASGVSFMTNGDDETKMVLNELEFPGIPYVGVETMMKRNARISVEAPASALPSD